MTELNDSQSAIQLAVKEPINQGNKHIYISFGQHTKVVT